MPQSSAVPGTSQPEANVHEVDGVPVYGRQDNQGRLTKIDAIDQDQRKIRAIADHLQAPRVRRDAPAQSASRQGLLHAHCNVGRRG